MTRAVQVCAVVTATCAPIVGSAMTVPQIRRLGVQPPPAPPTPPVTETSPSDTTAPPAEAAPAQPTPSEAAPVETEVAAEDVPRITGIRGQVVDAQNGEPLIEATVRVTRGAKKQTTTDLDGRFTLKLPPGEYDLRVSYDIYKGRRIQNVVVRRGEATVIDVKLEPDESAVEEVVVEAKADTRTEAGILQARKKAVTAGDSLSAQQMARSPDSSAADAAKRVPSATVVEGRYVLVRGLGGRYSTTLVNRAPVPSPEPDEQAVPLDLFPAALLANLTVVKTHSSDLPGQFAGGTLLIETSAYPKDLQLKLNVSTTYDSQTTFRSRNDYPGGSLDWLGFEDGTRDLPDSVPRDGPVQEGEDLDDADIERIGEDFANVWSIEQSDSPPSFSVGATVGDTLRPGGRRLGYLASVGFGRTLKRQDTDVASLQAAGGELSVRQELTSSTGTETASIGALGNVSFEPAQNHDVELFTLYTHKGRDRAQFISGFSETDGLDIEETRLQFVEQALTFGQIHGRHRFSRAGNLVLEWQGNASLATRDEPDTREINYFVLEDDRRRFQDQPGSGERFFSNLRDVSGGGGLHVERPFGRLRPQAGGSAQHTERTFEARRLRFNFIGRTDPSVLFLPPEEMLSPENIGPHFELEERTQPTDAYDASLTIAAGYAMIDVGLTEDLRVIPGVRYERATQVLEPGSPFAISQTEVEAVDRTESDAIPSVNMVYSVTPRMNLRAAYSRTLARPHFRELAPFLYYDYSRRRAVSGNPALHDTHIDNADLRWELFPRDSEVVAASVFYKRFDEPIEQVIVNTGGDVSFDNAAAARAYGLELEGRIGLRHFARVLGDFSAGANFSLIQSKVELAEDQIGVQTSADRPMQGQSPYVVNFDLGFARGGTEVTLLYNVFGRRLEEVGTSGLPDVYEQPFHRVDLAAGQKLGGGLRLKLSGTNLLNRRVVTKQGDFEVESYPAGVTAAAALSWSP